MITIDGPFDVIMLLIYPLEALFLLFLSKKCFFDKIPVWKAIAIFLISPAAPYYFSYALSQTVILDTETITGALSYYTVYALSLVGLQLFFMGLYIRLVRAGNNAIALFIYLSVAMLLPDILLMFSTGYTDLGVFSTIVLTAAFYWLVGRKLPKISRERLMVNSRTFVTLSIVVFLYQSSMCYFELFRSARFIDAMDKTVRLMDLTQDSGEAIHGVAKQMAVAYLEYDSSSPVFLTLSNFIVLLVLIGAFKVITNNIMYMNDLYRSREEVKELAVEMMEALAHTIDAKDKYTRGHSVRVARYSKMIATRMGLSDKECEDVYYYGLLHDIGKIGVPNEIINSDKGLSDDQYKVIKTHPVIGYDILHEVKSRPDLMTGARWHHERYDGKGYPDGKSGEDIPLLARIIAVADSYDAMTSNRSYRDYLPQDVVRSEIEKNAGTQFDPKIAKYMLEIIDEDKEYKLHE